MATYQMSYGFNPDGTKNENPLKFDDEKEEEEEAAKAAKLKEKLDKEAAKTTKKKPSKSIFPIIRHSYSYRRFCRLSRYYYCAAKFILLNEKI